MGLSHYGELHVLHAAWSVVDSMTPTTARVLSYAILLLYTHM